MLRTVFLACLPALTAPAGDPFERFELDGGARLLVLQVEEAPLQSLFAILPHGLLHDAAGRAQFAHLLEHALIRGVDPQGLEVDGARINGETTAGALRLEVMEEPARWREGLERLARWLAVRELDPLTLAREQERIAAEEAATMAQGAAHKWAQAAWAQVVVHGAEVARVHGDVAGSTTEQVAAYACERARLGAGALVVAVGPVAAEEVAAAARELLAPVLGAPAADAPRLSSASIPVRGDLEARWDLPAHHLLAWWVLPAAQPAERAAAWLLGQRLGLELAQARPGATSTAQPLVDGRMMLLAQVPLDGAGEAQRARKELARAAERAADAKALRREARRADGLGELPHLPSLRARLAGSPAADLLEAQVALNLAAQELAAGLTLPELARACAELDAEACERASEVLRKAPATLLLIPTP